MPFHLTRYYRAYGLTLASNTPIVELPSSADVEPDLRFDLRPANKAQSTEVKWFHKWLLPDGEAWLFLGKLGQDYLLRFPYLSDFLIADEGRSICCFPEDDITAETISHLLLDQVIPLVISWQGKVVLHAGAVVLPQGAIAFMGKTGQGKSTLAAALSQRGCPLLTDDGLLLEEFAGRIAVTPSYPGLRLWPEMISIFFEEEPSLSKVAQYSKKKRVKLHSARMPFSRKPVPLQGVYLLAPPQETEEMTEVVITRLSPQESFIELVKHTFQLDITDHVKLQHGFEAVGRLAAAPIYYRLAFQRNVALLPTVCEAIIAHAENNA